LETCLAPRSTESWLAAKVFKSIFIATSPVSTVLLSALPHKRFSLLAKDVKKQVSWHG